MRHPQLGTPCLENTDSNTPHSLPRTPGKQSRSWCSRSSCSQVTRDDELTSASDFGDISSNRLWTFPAESDRCGDADTGRMDHGPPADSPRSASSAASPGAPPGPRRPHRTVSGPGEETDAAVTHLHLGTSWCSPQVLTL